MSEEVKKAFKLIRGEPGEDPEPQEQEQPQQFESPIPALEGIFAQVRDTAKTLGIVLPPPFLPDFPTVKQQRRVKRAELPQEEKVQKAQLPPPETVICPQCHFQNVKTAYFCQNCGFNLKEAPQEEEWMRKEDGWAQQPQRDSHWEKRRHSPSPLGK